MYGTWICEFCDTENEDSYPKCQNCGGGSKLESERKNVKKEKIINAKKLEEYNAAITKDNLSHKNNNPPVKIVPYPAYQSKSCMSLILNLGGFLMCVGIGIGLLFIIINAILMLSGG
jgi:hypothetical protein